MKMLANFTFSNEYWVFLAPVFFILIDIATGFLSAWKEENINSSALRNGLVKKCGELFCIAIGEILTYGLSLPHYIIYGISLYIILMEIISNLENISEMGVKVPRFVTEKFKKVDDLTNADYASVKKDIDAAWNEIRKLEENKNGRSE